MLDELEVARPPLIRLTEMMRIIGPVFAAAVIHTIVAWLLYHALHTDSFGVLEWWHKLPSMSRPLDYSDAISSFATYDRRSSSQCAS